MLCMSTLLTHLKNPNSQLSRTLNQVKNWLNIKEVMSKNIMGVLIKYTGNVDTVDIVEKL